MKVLLYEHISSGGYAGKPFPPHLLCEGYAMLRGLAADFKAVGYEVLILLDARIAAFNPPLCVDHIFRVEYSMDVSAAIKKAAKQADMVYAIAPETKRTLQSIVEAIEEAGTQSLNCPAKAIAEATDKADLRDCTRNLELNFPQTEILEAKEILEKTSKAIEKKLGGFPVVVKLRLSAGCEGLCIAQDLKQLTKAILKIRNLDTDSQVTVQELISGVPASVTVLCNGKEALPLSLNLQQVTLESVEGTSRYDGGVVPFDHTLRNEAFSASKRLVESFGNLRGYVGVDFVLSTRGAFVVEINPRLTTSYVGLRKVVRLNMAEALFQAACRSKLPENSKTQGFSCFEKFSVSCPSISAWQQICNLETVAAPPFPFVDVADSCAMVQSWGKTFTEASFWLRVVEERIQQI